MLEPAWMLGWRAYAIWNVVQRFWTLFWSVLSSDFLIPMGASAPIRSEQLALAANGDLVLKLGHGGAGDGDGCAHLGDVADPVARV